MADDVPSLRPPLLPLRALLAGVALLAAGTGAVLGGIALRDWRAQRRTEAALQATAQDRAIAEQIIAHIAALRHADMTAAPTTACPPAVTGKLPLVEKPVLDWLVDDGSEQARPQPTLTVRSPVFHYLDGSRTPSVDDRSAIEARHAAVVALRSARYLAVVSGDATAVTAKSETIFEGGEVDATVAIGEITAGRFVCSVRFTSQPAMILWLRQRSAEANRGAERQAAREAMTRAFQVEASKQLAVVAPGATLDVE